MSDRPGGLIPFLLRKLGLCGRRRKPREATTISFMVDGIEIPNGGSMDQHNQSKKNMIAHFTKADGTPARVDGIPVWTVSDPTKGVMEPSADGFSCKSVPAEPGVTEGPCDFTVTADADLGAGVRSLSATITVNYLPLEATAASIEEGAEEPI
jgi:hypothetical protein